jgi:hypothetical protein
VTGGAGGRLFAPATERNREPIATVLARMLPETGAVLEIASGTGEHVVHFARMFPRLVFQPSDPDAAHRASIGAWTAFGGHANIRQPLVLDVTTATWPVPDDVQRSLVAVVCINMIHISPWTATLGLMRGAGRILPKQGVLYLYGPYKRAGAHTAPSNEAFDRSLRERNAAWGVRDLEAVVASAETEGLAFVESVDMPANNLSVVFRKR